MTEETPMKSKARYFLEQFLKHTEAEERAVLLEEYDILEDVSGSVKGKAGNYVVPEKIEPDDEYEAIAVEEATKHDLRVLNVESRESDVPRVATEVALSVEFRDVVVEMTFVKKRYKAPGADPVEIGWYRDAVSAIIRHNFDHDE